MAEEIIASGSATHGQLGLSVQDTTSGTTSGFTTGAKVTYLRGGKELTTDVVLGSATAG